MRRNLKQLFSFFSTLLYRNGRPIETLAATQTTWLSRVQIRHLTPEDLPTLEWEGEFTHFRRVYADAYERFQHSLSILWVADLPEAGIIGQVFIQLICDRPELADGVNRAYLYSFRVRQEYRSAGLGSRIMEVVMDDLRRRGYTYLILNVAKDNLRARKLYERHYFHVVAHEPGRWTFQDEKGAWRTIEEPAWRMERKL